MLDHMSSTGVMHGDGRRCGEERVKHEKKKKNISAVHVQYRNREGDQLRQMETDLGRGSSTQEVEVDRKARIGLVQVNNLGIKPQVHSL